MRSASVGFQCPDCVKLGAATTRTPRAVYGGRASERPDVTYALIALNVIAFIATTLTGTGLIDGRHPSALFQRLGMQPLFIAFGDEYYRLITSTFLHFGLVHIALNMYCLYLLGPTLERSLGRLRFSALYLISGLAGSALSYSSVLERDVVYKLSAGASGAVFGLFAAFYVITRKRGEDASAITSTIVINLVFSFVFSGSIDWRGHVGGLIGGALVALALVYAPAGPQRWLYQAAGCLAVLAIVAGLVGWRTHDLHSRQRVVSQVQTGAPCPHCGDPLGRTTPL